VDSESFETFLLPLRRRREGLLIHPTLLIEREWSKELKEWLLPGHVTAPWQRDA
jgi:hypothetical protein